jgi:hypothetical protein
MADTDLQAESVSATLVSADSWDRILSDYLAKREFSDRMPRGAPGEDDAVNEYCAAMDRVIMTPVPSLQALSAKTELVSERYEGFEVAGGVWSVIQSDIQRLAAPDWKEVLQAFCDAKARLDQHSAASPKAAFDAPETLAYEETTGILADDFDHTATRLLLTDAPDLAALQLKLDVLASAELTDSVWNKRAEFARQVAADGRRLLLQVA